ncbi:MAG: transcriptional regulator [Candidatus Anoxymicrobium japonicum]|uniref:Transcriptional regulator n=1 Tax=Candidatus Anoxymicrobium japonicum TaxID=2013648 RepID=A0A2N3G6Q7_9ACTN|nr:MAG: transcriptional regulator [Candidatus Anoxymicrobium japonicum]
MNVPLIDLARQYRELEKEIELAVRETLFSGNYILGSQVDEFEREIASYLGVEHAVGVGSGTDALYLILKGLGIGPGDEVITTAFTFVATADVIANCGASPVFADIDPLTFNLDPESVRARVGSRTKAIVAVHLFGLPVDMDPFVEIAENSGLSIIEDCAQSLGAAYRGRMAGSTGAAAALSFFPTKNLGCAGDGGMVCTRDEQLAERVRMLRAHGSKRKYCHEILGVNSRLDALQAAILRVKLTKLDAWNSEKREIASVYNDSLTTVVTPPVPSEAFHVYHQYTIRSEERDVLKEKLSRAGVSSAIYYQLPLHLQPCFRYLGYRPGELPESESAADQVLSLPIFPGMTAAEVERVRDAINSG